MITSLHKTKQGLFLLTLFSLVFLFFVASINGASYSDCSIYGNCPTKIVSNMNIFNGSSNNTQCWQGMCNNASNYFWTTSSDQNYLHGDKNGSYNLHTSGNIISNGYVEGDGGILSQGINTVYSVINGSGTRLEWIPSRTSFRAGSLDDAHATAWDDGPNINFGSVVFGENNFNSGRDSMAIGSDNIVQGDYAFVGGLNSNANGDYSFVYAIDSFASPYSTVFGESNSVIGGYGFCDGEYNNITSDYSSILGGQQNTIDSNNGYSTIINGYGNFIKNPGGYALSGGYFTNSKGFGSLAYGYDTNENDNSFVSSGLGSVAMGYSSNGKTLKAEGTGSVAMGQDVNALTNNNILVFGKGFSQTNANTFNVGFGENDFQISHGNETFWNDKLCNSTGSCFTLTELNNSGSSMNYTNIFLINVTDNNITVNNLTANNISTNNLTVNGWNIVKGASPLFYQNASTSISTNTSFRNAGLGKYIYITPLSSGIVKVHVEASYSAIATSATYSYQLVYGNGTAPSFNSTANGTLLTYSVSVNGVVSTPARLGGWEREAIVFNLTKGTTYWFDVQCATASIITPVNCPITNLEADVEELPY